MYIACNLCHNTPTNWSLEDWSDGYCGKCSHLKQEHKKLLDQIRGQEETIRSIRDEGFVLLEKYASELTNNEAEIIIVEKKDLIKLWYALQLRWYNIVEPADFLADCMNKSWVIRYATDLFQTKVHHTEDGKSKMRRLYEACVNYLAKYSKEENDKYPLDIIP